jgi:hypothetical protein
VKQNDSRNAILAALPTFPQDAPMAWAAVCGVVSVIGLRWDWTALARLLAVVVLVELVYRWVAWLISLGEFRSTGSSSPVPHSITLPYTLPGSPAHRAADRFARARRFWKKFWTLPRGLWVRTLALLLAAGLLLCCGIGSPAMWIGVSGLAAAVLGGVWMRKSPQAADVWAPAFFTALAWITGALAAGGGWRLGLLAALAFGLATSGLAALRCGLTWGTVLTLAGLAASSIVLIALRLVLPAAAVLFVAAPGYALSARGAGLPDRFARTLRPLLLICMAVAAFSLGW